jgi:ribosomal protein L11 methyltransferase
VFSITVNAASNERDILVADLWDAGTSGITESEDWVRAFFEDNADSDSLMHRFRDYRPTLEQVDEHDWVAESKSQWQPFPVGERFYLVPDWRDDPAPCGRIRLKIHPGMACGTGTHPATQLCLQAMERYVQEGQAVIDVGTGTGILADAARLLGADPVVGCDIDIDAAAVAHKNLQTSTFVIPVFAGSLRSVRSESMDMVVANLNLATLQAIKQDALRVLNESGSLILSGFAETETPRVVKAFGRDPRATLEMDGYSCLVL